MELQCVRHRRTTAYVQQVSAQPRDPRLMRHVMRQGHRAPVAGDRSIIAPSNCWRPLDARSDTHELWTPDSCFRLTPEERFFTLTAAYRKLQNICTLQFAARGCPDLRPRPADEDRGTVASPRHAGDHQRCNSTSRNRDLQISSSERIQNTCALQPHAWQYAIVLPIPQCRYSGIHAGDSRIASSAR